MEFLKTLLDPALIGKVLATVVLVNVVLSAAAAFLEKIKDLTATDLDNKAYDLINKVSGFLATGVSWISANIPNKPAAPAAKVEQK